MKKYEDYQTLKDNWLGDIPSHWDALRIKRIFQERKERNNPIVTDFILGNFGSTFSIHSLEKELLKYGNNISRNTLSKYIKL